MTPTQSQTVTAWNGLFAISLIASIAAVVLLGVFKPGQSTGPRTDYGSILKIQETARKADAASESARATVAAQQWTESQATLGSSVLTVLAGAAERRNVQVASFRSEKPVEVARLREAPFVAVVEGKYPDVAALIQSLDDPKVKLTLNLLEISGSESGPGQVRATLGLVAFGPWEES